MDDDFTAHIGEDDRRYFKRVIKDLALRMDQRLVSQERAVEVAVTEMNRRLDILNHAFERADAVARQTLSRDVYESEHRTLSNRVERIEQRENKLIGALILATLVIPLAVAGLTHLLST